MRMLKFLVIFMGVIIHVTISTQVANTQPASPGVDFSGVYAAVYVGSPDEIILEPSVYPFTAEAERSFSAFDPAVSDPRVSNDCAAERMPGLLWSANPMEILQESGRIEMRFEEGDTVRSILVNGTAPSASQQYTELGYSVAYWEEDVLIIETTHLMDGVVVNGIGQPISREAKIRELYWRESGNNDLQMELLVEDPVNYTEPIKLRRVWGWAPSEQVRPWRCFPLGYQESDTLNVDELARMLEEL